VFCVNAFSFCFFFAFSLDEIMLASIPWIFTLFSVIVCY
jgi:hypothetical protein